MDELRKSRLNNKSPQLSVLMPVYNGEAYLVAAVESILQQSYDNFDFIIINDGSTDKSLEILQKFSKNDKRIKLISRENKGLVHTLNEGLALIHTPFIARMDADDIALPMRFEKQMQYLNDNNDCLLLGTRVIIIDADGDEICEMGDYFSHSEIDQGLLESKGQLIYHPSVIFRKAVVDQLGGYSYLYPHVEDLDLFLKISELGRIENLREPLLKYREHISKIGHLHRNDQILEINDVIKATYARRKLAYKETPTSPSIAHNEIDSWKIWAWWALKAKNFKTARKYALKLLITSPFSLGSWRLLYCVLRGY
jgi:glycosyltransferase involved in cell wall biosynthesis